MMFPYWALPRGISTSALCLTVAWDAVVFHLLGITPSPLLLPYYPFVATGYLFHFGPNPLLVSWSELSIVCFLFFDIFVTIDR